MFSWDTLKNTAFIAVRHSIVIAPGTRCDLLVAVSCTGSYCGNIGVSVTGDYGWSRIGKGCTVTPFAFRTVLHLNSFLFMYLHGTGHGTYRCLVFMAWAEVFAMRVTCQGLLSNECSSVRGHVVAYCAQLVCDMVVTKFLWHVHQ